jgi:hypothetical protein
VLLQVLEIVVAAGGVEDDEELIGGEPEDDQVVDRPAVRRTPHGVLRLAW